MAVPSIVIRRFEAGDWTGVWTLLHDTFEKGDTYAFAPGSSEAAGFASSATSETSG